MDVLAVRWREQQARKDRPMALLIQVMLNVHRDSEQRPQPFDLEEVMGFLGHQVPQAPPPPPPTVKELVDRVGLLHQLYSMGSSNGTTDG